MRTSHSLSLPLAIQVFVGRLEVGDDSGMCAGMVTGGKVVCVQQMFLKMFGGSIQKKKGSGIPS